MTTPEKARKRDLHRTQLNFFVQNMSSEIYSVPALMALIGVLFTYWFHWSGPAIWAAFAIGGYAVFFYLCKWGAARGFTGKEFERWAMAVLVANTVTEAIWASIGIWFWIPGDVLNNALILAVLAAALAPAVGLSAIYLPMLYSALLIPAAVLVLRPIFTGDEFMMGVGVLAAVYTYFLVSMGKRVHATTSDMLSLRNEKDALISRLEDEKSVAEEERAKAQEASQSKSAFLASVSHELRTPLNAIIGFSDVMRGETFGPLGHRNYLQYAEDIHGSGRHLLSLIDDILDLARIEAGRLELTETPVDLRETADECMRMIEINAARRQIRVNIDMPRSVPRILADDRAIRQIWLNLASNALKFTETGGTVTLFAAPRQDGSIAFGVRDTGCGMCQEELDQVMEAFTQGRSKARTGERGTGLGLAIVNGLTEAHGGRVELASTVGQGTQATVILPRARAIANELRRARETA